MRWNKNKNIKIVTSTEELQSIEKKYLDSRFLSFDTETTGLGRFDEFVGIGFAISEDEAIYIPYKIWNPETNSLKHPWSLEALEYVDSWIIKQLMHSKRLICHNASFDCKAVDNTLCIDPIEFIYADTGLLHHTVIDEEPPHGLKALATKFIDESASDSQEDLKESVKATGGAWKAADKEFYKGAYTILGRYCCFDVLFTFGLFNRFMPKVEEEGMLDLWNQEVMPMLQVTHQLNMTGIRIDTDYFEQLKDDMESNIKNMQAIIFAEIEDSIVDYEVESVLSKYKVSSRSKLGKYLFSRGYNGNEEELVNFKSEIVDWYKEDKSTERVINLDSNKDKAFILFDILELPCHETTANGGRKVTAAILKRLEDDYADSSEILKIMIDRSKEKKLLSTYVVPFLEKNIHGRMYPSFNQSGTTSGRYSSNNPNFQNIPARDDRIKKGIIADDGYVFVNADYASLEPRSFAHCSNEDSIKKVYTDNLDFYSHCYITVMGDTSLSANPDDPNYLGLVDKKLRQDTKAWALGLAYGMSEFKLAKVLEKDVEDTKLLKEKYFKAFPNLLNYHKKCQSSIKVSGYVTSIVGRRRRAKLVPELHRRGYNPLDRRDVRRAYNKGNFNNYESDKKLMGAVGNEVNNSYNFGIQSLAASIVNAAAIKVLDLIKTSNIDCRIVLQVHDELTLLCKKEDSEKASEILREAMETNRVTDMVSVKMVANPLIASRLSEAK